MLGTVCDSTTDKTLTYVQWNQKGKEDIYSHKDVQRTSIYTSKKTRKNLNSQ